jgi:ABC-type uncharacterized transport system fused permease/ATPase subunit|eukprot:SAG25_NODE_1908_length_2156_cov_1.276616_1_plen_59_part_00
MLCIFLNYDSLHATDYTTAHFDGVADADQRIAEDVPKLCTHLSALFPGLIKPVVDIIW